MTPQPPMTDGRNFRAGDRVIYKFDGWRAGRALREIVCEVVDPIPFSEPDDRGKLRLRVRCIDDRDPMNGTEFIPYASRLRAANA